MLTRWVVVAEFVTGSGDRYTQILTGDHDDLGLMPWDELGLLQYACEKAKQAAWNDADDDEAQDEAGSSE